MTVMLSTGYVEKRNGSQSFGSLFNGGCIEVRTGTQPANADMPVTGDLIARITRNGSAWTPGSPTAGLRFDVSGRQVFKRPTDDWRLAGIAEGTAGWIRLVGPEVDAGGASVTLPRIDGAVAEIGQTVDAQLFLPTLEITDATLIDINYWWFATPPLSGE